MRWLRIVAASQAVMGAFFVLLIFARVVASLPRITDVVPGDHPASDEIKSDQAGTAPHFETCLRVGFNP
jgi:hypothetical protein